MRKKLDLPYVFGMFLIIVLISAIITASLSTLFFLQYQAFLQEKIIERSQILLEALAEDVRNSFKDYTDVLYRLSYSDGLREVLYDLDRGSERSESAHLLRQSYEKVVFSNILKYSSIMDVNIYLPEECASTRQNFYCLTFDDAKAAGWYDAVTNLNGKIYYSDPAADINGLVPGRFDFVSAIRAIVDANDPDTVPRCFLEIRFRSGMLLYSSIYKNQKALGGTIYVVNSTGSVLGATHGELIGQNINDFLENISALPETGVTATGRQILFSSQIENTDLRLIAVINTEDYLSIVLDNLNSRIIPTVIGIFLIVLIIGYLLSLRSTKRLRILLMNARKSFENNEDLHLLNVRHRNELDDLSTMFSSLSNYNQQLTNELLKLELLQKSSELAYLQAQVNPHFLYNILDSINWLALKNGQERISTIINALARYYRASLSQQNNVRSIGEELAECENYIFLVNTISADSILFEVVIPDTRIKELGICSHLLQPILENSVKHGIRQKPDMRGKIILQGEPDNQGNVCFTITDDGIGIDPQIAEQLNAGEQISIKTSPLGFANVNKRIKVLYGSNYGAKIKNCQGKTVVQIVVPAIVLPKR